jgi:hypothetical protein
MTTEEAVRILRHPQRIPFTSERDAIANLLEAKDERIAELERVANDLASGIRYVRGRQARSEPDPYYGFGIDRLEAALSALTPPSRQAPLDNSKEQP